MTGYKRLTRKEIDRMIRTAEGRLIELEQEFGGYQRAQYKYKYRQAKERIADLKKLKASTPK